MKRFRYVSFIGLAIVLGIGTTTLTAAARNQHAPETLSPGMTNNYLRNVSCNPGHLSSRAGNTTGAGYG